MAVTIQPKFSNQAAQSANPAENAYQAIEVALQELVNNGVTSVDNAVWAKHSNDTGVRDAVNTSIGAGKRIS
jgi:hypothetical protein